MRSLHTAEGSLLYSEPTNLSCMEARAAWEGSSGLGDTKPEVTSGLKEVTASLLPGFTVPMNQPSLVVTTSESEVWAGCRG